MTDPRQAAFDAVRAISRPGLFNDPGNILALDNLLDAFGAPRMSTTQQLGPKGEALIKKWEGCAKKRPDGRFDAYPDPGSVDGKPWTIGWGSTGADVKKGVIWTQAQCDARFAVDIVDYVKEVAAFIGLAPTTQNQFDALVSFHYNTGAIRKSTLGSLHRQGKFPQAQEQFGKWIYNDGKPMNGLKSRRAEEAALYGSN